VSTIICKKCNQEVQQGNVPHVIKCYNNIVKSLEKPRSRQTNI